MNCFLKEMEQKFIVRKSIEAAYLKILINYLQLISIIKNLKINWSTEISRFQLLSSSISGSFVKIISFDCIFQGIIYIDL